jgi:hypothetical protein
MSDFTRVDRTLPSGPPITILTPGRRPGGGGGAQRRGGGADHRGRSHVHPAVDPIAAKTRSPEVSMHDR